jgi:cation:H+ antiporter
LGGLPLWLNALLFAMASSAIWWAGTRLELYADLISKRTGMSQSFTGMVLLATVTSLPELATTVTAVVVLGNAKLAIYNLLGGVAMQTALLAFADLAKPRSGAMTFFTPSFVLIIQGLGLVVLLLLSVAGLIARGLPSVLSVSLWPVLIVLVYAALLYITYRRQGQPRWTPSALDDVPEEIRSEYRDTEPEAEGADRRPVRLVWLIFAGLSLLVLGGGYLATESAEGLARQTGLSDAFVGATLLALATSLPEVSTTFAAIRNERYTVAISNIFGSNAFCVALLILAEVLYRDGTIFDALEPPVVFVPAIGAIMTCIYLWGLLERENRTLGRIGWDSAAALLTYAGGMTVLYFLS